MNEPEILEAYSAGRIGAGRAIALLGLGGAGELLVLTVDAGLELPRPPADEVERQIAAALPLLRAVLIPPKDER